MTIVVDAGDDAGRLQAGLASAASACERAGAELIVVCCAATPPASAMRALLPGVRWVVAPADTAPRDRRVIGLRAAHGDMVRLTEAGALLDERRLLALLDNVADPTLS